MNKYMHFIIRTLFASFVVGFVLSPAMAADPAPVKASKDVKVLLDNDRVRVVEANRTPGTIQPMHTHPPFMAYYLSPAKVKITSASGKVSIKDIPGGKLTWFPNGTTHALEVLGTTNQHVLVIELKK